MKKEKKTSAKVMDVLRTVLVVIVVAIAVFMLIFTLATRLVRSEKDDPNKDLFGYRLFVVTSGSMRATHFAEGDIIITKVVDPNTLNEGDVITFYDPTYNRDNTDNTDNKPDKDARVITHMIKRYERTEDNEHGFRTFGTTTGVEDNFVVPYSHILGEYQFKIPFGGHFLAFFRTLPGYICCILVPFLILLLSQGISFVRTIVLYRKEQNAIIAAERAKLNEEKAQAEQERAQAERDAQNMMAELEMLRQQLMKQNASIAEESTPSPEIAIEEPVSEEAVSEETVSEEITTEEKSSDEQ